jgi:hypothetical protein
MYRIRAFAPAFAAAAMAASLLTLAAPAAAQTATRAQAPTVTERIQVVDSQSAREIRDDLMEVLKRYPPTLARILKLDPTLLTNPNYLAPYPVLAQFLTNHPEVARSPRFFFEEIYAEGDYYRNENETNPQFQAISMWRNTLESFTILLGFLAGVGAVTWVLRSIIEHRRWSRMAKTQTDVHTKLIDRLASNEEMMAYIQSPAGARYLQAGPGPSVAVSKAIHAPFGRILWSAQAGVVLLALGLGMRWINPSAPAEVVDMLKFLGMIGVSLGIGFLFSAGLAYVLSRQMGLIDPNAPLRERNTPSES